MRRHIPDAMRHRLAILVPIYVLLYSLAYLLAYVIRFEFDPTPARLLQMSQTLPLILVVQLLSAMAWGEFRRSFRYGSASDLSTLAGSSCLSLLLVATFCQALSPAPLVPRSVICMNAALAFLFSGALRIGHRTLHELLRPLVRMRRQEAAQRTLIFGTGEPSVGILRMLTTGLVKNVQYRPVGFVTDLFGSSRSMIGGLKVYSIGADADWKELQERTGAESLLIPGDTPGRIVRQLLHACASADIKVLVIPTVDNLMDGRFKLTVCDVTVSDLLRREPNQLDMESIRDYVTGRRVLVTGGAGSIGSELCRQIADLEPERLVVYDQSEFGMFSIEQEFAELDHDFEIHYVIGDVLDEAMLSRTMIEHQPQLVFHAAAYKHVPLMEDNPQAAIFNNILGTKAVADAAAEHHVERFVLISTDKAVRPTSVMGASKLMAEKYIQSLAQFSETHFITVRFGNVLNSTGSVVPTFRKQIERGGPLTVTHPEMRRFFMTIPEAVQLVLQAGAIGPNGSVLILDMGEPVKIVDLAQDMIMLSGLRCPDDIEIHFTGMRPGEKLYEELFYESESSAEKIHEKIYCGDADAAVPLPLVIADIRQLEEAAQMGRDATLETLQEVLAKYTDCQWVPSRLSRAA